MPSNVPFTVGDVNDKRTLAHAMAQGYHVRLDADGCAEVVSPAGSTYHVHDNRCTCPDHLARNGGSHGGFCKHTWWTSQLFPCDHCSGTMQLGAYTTAFGEVLHTFTCPRCSNAKQFTVVYGQRLLARARRKAVA